MRYNIFSLVHKGLRAALYHTGLELQQTDFTIEKETEDAINRVREIILLFDSHAHKEDQFILPAIATYEPSVVATFECEHVEDMKLGARLNLCIDKLERSNTLLEKIASGRELTEAFVSFMVFNLQHMSKEEDILNRLLWRYYADDEIKKIGTEIGKNVDPWIQDLYATWILRGINHSDTVKWVRAIKKEMPVVVFHTLLQKAEQELSSTRFRKLSSALRTEMQLVE